MSLWECLRWRRGRTLFNHTTEGRIGQPGLDGFWRLVCIVSANKRHLATTGIWVDGSRAESAVGRG